LAFTRKDDQIAAEASLDGIYVLRTSLPEHRAMLEICGFAREGAYLPEWSVKVPS